MKKALSVILCVALIGILAVGCSSGTGGTAESSASTSSESASTEPSASEEASAEASEEASAEPTAEVSVEATDDGNELIVDTKQGGNEDVAVINTDLTLTDYQPKKDSYNFYFTYKLVHPWWDTVRLGMEDAVNQYKERGINIDFEYVAPVAPDAADQVSRLEQAAGRDFDVIGVDVTDIEIVTPTINKLIDDGAKIMTFSTSDSTKEDGCKRIAYVGNTHNYEDGADLAEIMAEAIDYKGQVAALGGTPGAPVHEARIAALKDVVEKYPDIELVEIQYDNDQVEAALTYTEGFLQKYPDLKAVYANNMSNPIGAAQAVVDAGKAGDIVVVGLEHDLRELEFLRDGVITALGIQDSYKIGFDTIQVAVMIADGVEPTEGLTGPTADGYPEQTQEKTTIVYADGAQPLIDKFYPDSESATKS